MLFFSKNKNIVKCAVLLFIVTLAGVVLNTDNTHASELSAFFTWNTNTNADGRDILDSDSKSMQMLAELYVQGADDSGFTVSVHTKNNTTSLVNEEKFVNDEIKSISENLTLDNFKGNNWGFSTDGTNYQPIPDKNHPKLIANQDSRMVKTYYAIKLNENIKPANYKNTVVYSVVSNQIANLPSGIDFNKVIKEIAGGEENVVHIKSSNTIPEGANVKNIAANADVKGEFKIWYEPSEKTVYYWTSTKYAYLNENSEKMFDGFSNLESIDTTKLNASFATTTANMFSKNPKLKTLNFGKYIFNTEKITDMHEMFADTGLEEIPVNNYVGWAKFFDTKNVVNMSGMFARTRQLKDIRFAEFIDLRNAEDLSYMFYGLNGKEYYYLGDAFGKQTKKVKKLDYIFATDQENKIKNIEVEYSNYDDRTWSTENVESYEGMFAGRTNYESCGLNGENIPVSDLAWLRVGNFSHSGYFCAYDHL